MVSPFARVEKKSRRLFVRPALWAALAVCMVHGYTFVPFKKLSANSSHGCETLAVAAAVDGRFIAGIFSTAVPDATFKRVTQERYRCHRGQCFKVPFLLQRGAQHRVSLVSRSLRCCSRTLRLRINSHPRNSLSQFWGSRNAKRGKSGHLQLVPNCFSMKKESEKINSD